ARFLASAGAPDGDLDDLVQETFIRAFRGVDRFRGQCRFRTWLLTIGGNVLKDAARRARRAKVVPLHEELRATDGDPHERAVAGEAEGRLLAGLVRLSRMQREVFLLRAQQGLAYEEIAAAVVLLLGTGAVTKALWRPQALAPAGGEAAAAGLNDLSTDQLQQLLEVVDTPADGAAPVYPPDATLDDLTAPQLRELLRSLEG